MPAEVITRRNLPHWYMPHAFHFITFRLAGTIPREVLDDLQARKDALLRRAAPGALHRERIHKQLFADFDAYLDANRTIHWLDSPPVAALVRRSLYFWSGKKYGLFSYCIMPNHTHVLLQPFDIAPPTEIERESQEPGECADSRSPLAEIMHSIKSYTAHEANKLLGRSGSFWQHESYDHWVRDEEELQRIVDYINANPVLAGLTDRACRFDWCSAHDRYLHDGDESGWLSVEQASCLLVNPTDRNQCAGGERRMCRRLLNKFEDLHKRDACAT
jgi:putative DNA methylase